MRTRAVTALLMLVVLGLVACGDDGADPTATSEGNGAAVETTEAPEDDAPAPSGDAVRSAEVEIDDFEFVPASVTIEEGGKVIWKNRDSAEHTATLDDGSFDTGPLAEDKLKSQSFKRPGVYPYHCEIHPEMTGTVEVVGG